MAAINLIAGDTRPSRMTYKVAGRAVDITGYQFTLKIGYAPAVLAKEATIVDAANGIIEFPWSAEDLVAGSWPAEVLVVDADGKEKTHKIAGRLAIGSRME